MPEKPCQMGWIGSAIWFATINILCLIYSFSFIIFTLCLSENILSSTNFSNTPLSCFD